MKEEERRAGRGTGGARCSQMQGKVGSVQLGWGGARPLGVARGVLCSGPSSFDGAQCPKGPMSLPPPTGLSFLLSTPNPLKFQGRREAELRDLDLEHLAEASRSFLLLRGIPSTISGLTPGLLGWNLHSPLGTERCAQDARHPSSGHESLEPKGCQRLGGDACGRGVMDTPSVAQLSWPPPLSQTIFAAPAVT